MYDMERLLVSIVVSVLISGMNSTLAQTDKNTNSSIMVSIGSLNGTSSQNGTYTQTVNFAGRVDKIQTGQSIIIKVLKNDLLYKIDIVKIANNMTSSNLFYYQISVAGKLGIDLYKIDFTYGNQTVEKILPLAHTGIRPIPEFGLYTGMIVAISVIGALAILRNFRFYFTL